MFVLRDAISQVSWTLKLTGFCTSMHSTEETQLKIPIVSEGSTNASTWGENLATSPPGSYTLDDLLH